MTFGDALASAGDAVVAMGETAIPVVAAVGVSLLALRYAHRIISHWLSVR